MKKMLILLLVCMAFAASHLYAQVIIKPVYRRPCVVVAPRPVRVITPVRTVTVVTTPVVRRVAPLVVVRPARRVIVVR